MEWWREKAELITKRKERFISKLKSVEPRIAELEEVNSYRVKVADVSEFDEKKKQMKLNRPLNEYEKE